MMFPQENEPQRRINTDPREQPNERQSWHEVPPGSEQASYEAGYGGVEPGMRWQGDEKLRPLQKSPSTWQWILGAIAILLLAYAAWSLINFILGSFFMILGLAAGVIAISQFSARKIEMPTQTFFLDGKPKLVIRTPAGSVRVRRGEVGRVEIRPTKYVNGWFGSSYEGVVDCTQEGEIINTRVRSDYKWSPFGGLRNVDFDIIAPECSDIEIETNAGTINVTGISGQTNVKTSAGTIHMEQVTLEGRSSLNTNAGTIHIGLATLRGQVDANTNAGTIDFEGTIDAPGDYRLRTNAGTITAILRGNPSFTLNASTDLGTVNNDFGSTVVGPAPHAHLELHSNLGTVSVRRR